LDHHALHGLDAEGEFAGDPIAVGGAIRARVGSGPHLGQLLAYSLGFLLRTIDATVLVDIEDPIDE
jgi:hypothetical protein